MKPPACAYMRVFCDVTEHQFFAMEHRILAFAEEQGFHLVTIYQEFTNGSIVEFYEMCRELERSDIHSLKEHGSKTTA